MTLCSGPILKSSAGEPVSLYRGITSIATKEAGTDGYDLPNPGGTAAGDLLVFYSAGTENPNDFNGDGWTQIFGIAGINLWWKIADNDFTDDPWINYLGIGFPQVWAKIAFAGQGGAPFLPDTVHNTFITSSGTDFPYGSLTASGTGVTVSVAIGRRYVSGTEQDAIGDMADAAFTTIFTDNETSTAFPRTEYRVISYKAEVAATALSSGVWSGAEDGESGNMFSVVQKWDFAGS